MTLGQIEAALAKATKGKWYVVGLPWRRRDSATYAVAGNEDPHVGVPVLDGIDVDEWDADQPGPDLSQSDADLEAACAAVNALPGLLRVARAAEEVAALCEHATEPVVRLNPKVDALLDALAALGEV